MCGLWSEYKQINPLPLETENWKQQAYWLSRTRKAGHCRKSRGAGRSWLNERGRSTLANLAAVQTHPSDRAEDELCQTTATFSIM